MCNALEELRREGCLRVSVRDGLRDDLRESVQR